MFLANKSQPDLRYKKYYNKGSSSDSIKMKVGSQKIMKYLEKYKFIDTYFFLLIYLKSLTHAKYSIAQFSSVKFSRSSRVRLFATSWITVCQASLSITNSQSSLKLMPIELVMPSSYLILCRPLLLLPSIPPSIRVFSNESTLHMRWPKYWSFSFSISPSNEHPGLISFRMDWLDLLAVQGTLKSLLHCSMGIITYIDVKIYGNNTTKDDEGRRL